MFYWNQLQVFPYGSVPLKTYLPDGDIDLTAFVGKFFEDAFADDLVSTLEAADRNKDAEFSVKDVQLIRAEVLVVLFNMLYYLRPILCDGVLSGTKHLAGLASGLYV